MAKLTFDIPDAHMPDLVDAWGNTWLAEVADPNNPGVNMPNPQTKQQYAKEQIRKAIVDHIKWYQGNQIEEIPVT